MFTEYGMESENLSHATTTQESESEILLIMKYLEYWNKKNICLF